MSLMEPSHKALQVKTWKIVSRINGHQQLLLFSCGDHQSNALGLFGFSFFKNY